MNLPRKKRRNFPDHQVRDAANQFDDARLLLEAQPPGSGLLLPLVNNAVVALELYLKSLGAIAVYTPSPEVSIVTAEAEVKGHGLILILESIPDDVRHSLEEAYTARYTDRVLRDDLKKCEGLFVASRYAFEGNGSDSYPFVPLRNLCSFLRDFVWKMKTFARRDL